MNTIQNMQRREVLKTSTKVLGGALTLNMLGEWDERDFPSK